ncbi:MAG TPA: NAD-dependent epimerase/dehydratase family protein, partial [Marmoricola sp.]|nr:NAD-dependent epimerase/dehydratase family protein [Marmoricola sp.]
MEILILGGTGWLGAEVANAALAAGSDVTCLARGLAGGVPEGARLIVADRDNPNAYADVANRTWDGIVDLARHPGHARGAVRALAGSTALWAFVSSGNVYSSHAFAGGDESGELLA